MLKVSLIVVLIRKCHAKNYCKIKAKLFSYFLYDIFSFFERQSTHFADLHGWQMYITIISIINILVFSLKII